MSAEKFTVETAVIYTLKSEHGVQEFKGWDSLHEHGENTLGAFVDRMHSDFTGNLFRDKQRSFEFLMKNRQDLETIFAMHDRIQALQPRPAPVHCSGEDCNCPDCYADENN